MGGSIDVNSRPGEGATFWIDLPDATVLEEESNTSDDLSEHVKPVPYKILYIEDNRANLRLIETIFRQHSDMTLISAMNGEHGLELADHHQPDLILLDIHLPGMDGYEVFEKLLENGNTCDIPVIALSADAMQPDIEKGLEIGFKTYLTKPVDMNSLFKAISDVLEK
jgi:CheY-like chemotaxis protein